MAIKDYLVVDIEKPVATYVDLTNYFQGRVADADAYCKLWIKSGSTSVDMTNKKLRFYGKDSNATPFVAAGHFDDDQPGDDRQLGLITFYFPEGIFQKEGKWQEAFFKIEGADGSDISTINLTLNVLPNQVEMGISIRPFIPVLEETEAKINKALREMNAQQLLNQIDSMKTTVGAYTDLIEQHAVLNKPQTIDLVNGIVNPMRTELNSEMDSLKTNLNNQMNVVKDDESNALAQSRWYWENYNGTLLNGCTGWVSGQFIRNQDVVVGYLCGNVNLPEGTDKSIDFATNPLFSVMDFSNSTLNQIVMLWPENGQEERPTMYCSLDSGNSQLALWRMLGADNVITTQAYNFSFDMAFTMPASVLK